MSTPPLPYAYNLPLGVGSISDALSDSILLKLKYGDQPT